MSLKSIKIAFFGDSVTEGCFEIYPCSYGFETVRRPEDGYVLKTMNALRQKYGERRFEYKNFGKSGDSAYTALARAEEVLRYQPEIAVVCFGLNDALHEGSRFRKALESMLKAFKSEVPYVIFMTPNMLNSYLHPETLPCAVRVARKTMAAQCDGKFDRMMTEAHGICENFNIPVCDAYAHWKSLAASGVDTTELLVNKINHPTAEMHDILADMLIKTITSL